MTGVPHLLAVFTIGALLVEVQTAAQPRDHSIADRIAALSARLQDMTPFEAEGRDFADGIRKEVMAFIEGDLVPSDPIELSQARLLTILRRLWTDSTSSEAPKLRWRRLRHGRGLLVAYSLQWEPHHDSPTLTAFSDAGGTLNQVASVGKDFEGYGLYTHDIASPADGVMWALAWGQAHTFNGQKMRYRIYSFDGATLETVWAPDDMISATLEVLPDGFAITHLIREDRTNRTDQYKVTPNGLVRVR